MDILPIQGSAVPCERVFSSGKETTTARRNRISPELMEALQMLKFAVHKGRSLNFTAGTAKSVEIKELEAVALDEMLIPEDIMAFVATLQAEDDF
jgi:hAT family C-terminal dimerisation region